MRILDLAFTNVKPKDWYFVLDKVRYKTELGYVKDYQIKIFGWMDQGHHSHKLLLRSLTWAQFPLHQYSNLLFIN